VNITPGRAAAAVLGIAALVGAAALIAPRFDAGRFRAPLQEALERTLARKVEMREVRYRILPSPGLTALDVVIHELPEYGLEPLAYVAQLETGLSWSSLFTGRLEISSVRLVEASVNLARSEGGDWNFTRLLEQLSAGVRLAGGRPPSVILRAGRINFRLGDLKSAYYLNEVDLELAATASGGEGFEWNYECSPARTDRAETGFGNFRGRGEWNPRPSPGVLNVDFVLERSAASDVLMLLSGRDLGVSARLSSRTRLSGPLDHIKIEGNLNLEQFESASLFGLRNNNLSAPFAGTLDLVGQRLDLDTAPRQKDQLPVSIRFRASSILTQPTWAALVQLQDIPASTLVDVARRIGSRLPPDLALTGKVDGAVSFSSSEPTSGELSLNDVAATLGGGEPLKMAAAQVRIEGGALRLSPVQAESSPGSELEVGGLWDTDSGDLDLQLTARRLDLKDLSVAVARLPAATLPPLLADSRGGLLSGSLDFKTATGWSGNFELAGSRFEVPGVVEPVRVRRASVALKGDRYEVRRIDADWGDIHWTGEFDRRADPLRPYRLRLRADSADGAELERLLAPSLGRRSGFFARTLRLRGEAAPAWLRTRRVDGEISIRSLSLGAYSLAEFRSPFYWSGSAIEFPQVQVLWEEGLIAGRLTVRLGGDAPEYLFKGRVDNATWKGARFESDIDASTSGYGAGLLTALRGEGNLSARNVTLDDEIFRSVSACVDYAAPRLRLKCFDAVTSAGESFTGQSSLAPDGRLYLDLESPHRKLRLPLSE
jgi:hypothetical protein